MNREKFAVKLAVMALAGMMVASPAWAEKKGKASGPSEQETVEFINGLLACDRSSLENLNGWASVVKNSGIQRSTLIGSSSGKSTLTEILTRSYDVFSFVIGGGAPIRGDEMEVTIGYALSSKVAIPWGQLEQVNSADGTDVQLRCNPSHGACIQTTSKEVKRKTINKFGRDGGLLDIDGAGCHGEPVQCAEQAKNELGTKQPTQKNGSSWTINFCRPDDAVRGAKAINHLIELHGGKKSLF